MNDEPTVNVALTSRELTLIRVACIRRLDKIASSPESYAETKALLNGKLWLAVQALKREGQ